MRPAKIPKDAILRDGNYYNKYGVCLDCNDWQMECTHNNLAEYQGKIVCSMCGIAID